MPSVLERMMQLSSPSDPPDTELMLRPGFGGGGRDGGGRGRGTPQESESTGDLEKLAPLRRLPLEAGRSARQGKAYLKRTGGRSGVVQGKTQCALLAGKTNLIWSHIYF